MDFYQLKINGPLEEHQKSAVKCFKQMKVKNPCKYNFKGLKSEIEDPKPQNTFLSFILNKNLAGDSTFILFNY